MKPTRSDAISQAVRLAQERGLLPTTLSTAELQEFTERLKERIFFSARFSNLSVLEQVKEMVERYVKGEGLNSDLAQLRLEARKIIVNAGYTPEGGFPGDAELGIPPATAGSLRDLTSERRLNLIFDTQASMMRGLGQQLRGLDPTALRIYPAYELVRIKQAQAPRDWEQRWKTASDNVDHVGVAAADTGRLVALKTSPIWQALGSSALFKDALNVEHPPFAFSSGMAWSVVSREEAGKLGLVDARPVEDPLRAMVRAFLNRPFVEAEAKLPKAFQGIHTPKRVVPDLPPPPQSVDGLDRDFVRKLSYYRDEVRRGLPPLADRTQRALAAALAARQARGENLDVTP